MTGFELPSNRGTESLRWIVHGLSRKGLNPALFCDVELRARLYADENLDITLAAGEIWIRLADLQRLHQVLATWISEFDRGTARPLTDVITLSGTLDQQLVLSFGPRPDVINGRHETVTVRCNFGRFQG